MYKKAFLIALILVSTWGAGQYAVIAAGKHATQQTQEQSKVVIHIRPDFYSPRTWVVKDSTFTYECYDKRDSLIDEDTLTDFGLVRYISLWQKYIDHEHTYKDNNGIKQPLPIAKIAARYDKMGQTKWMVVKYPANKMSELKEYKNIIVSSDTTYSKSTGTTIITRYYRTNREF